MWLGCKPGYKKVLKNLKIYTNGTIRYGLLVSTDEPRSLSDALGNPQWRKAMEEECIASKSNLAPSAT
jgi:hypothetical protein